MPTIVVPAKMDHLDDAKDYLKKAIPPAYAQQTANVILVAEELLVNVFSYAYPDGAEGEAEISIGLVEDGFEAREVYSEEFLDEIASRLSAKLA